MSDIKLAKCPFCDAELKRWDYMPNVFFEHPYNGCILSGKKVLESKHDVKAWNTRKPMERILTRLEEKKQEYLEGFRTHQDNERYGVACGFGDSIKICKEVGGLNDYS